MKTKLFNILASATVAVALLLGVFGVSRIGRADINGTYIGLSASVNSTTVPVKVLDPGTYAAFSITTKSTAAAVIDCFEYTGSLPGSAPSNFNFFISPGQTYYDNQVQIVKLLPNYGVGCVLDSGSTAVATASNGRTG